MSQQSCERVTGRAGVYVVQGGEAVGSGKFGERLLIPSTAGGSQQMRQGQIEHRECGGEGLGCIQYPF